MAKKVTPNPNRCGQCSLKTWVEDNLTLTGKPFLLVCPHFKGGEVCYFAKDPACNHFKP
jgi:hypothetical protein